MWWVLTILLIAVPANAAQIIDFDCNNPGEALNFDLATGLIGCASGLGGGGGDNISVNSSAATDPSFNDGDIDWTLGGGGTTITGTVGCTDCVALKTETSGSFVESVATTGSLTGGAAGSEGATLTLDVADDAINGTELSDTLTLDANLQFSVGAYGVEFLVANPTSPGIDINGTGAFADDLLHVHQHTGNPTGGNLIHAEAADKDVTPLVHISALAPSTTTDPIVGLLIDTDDDDDASYVPLQITDAGATETLFKVTSTGSVAMGDGSGSPSLTFETSAIDPVLTATGGLLTLNTGHFDIDNGYSLRIGEPAAGGQYVSFQSDVLTANRSCTLQDAAAPIPDSCVGNGADDGSALLIDGGAIASANFDDGGDINFTNDGDGTVSTAVKANSVALTTDTTGNYAAGDGEYGNALSGDSATAFFSTGAIEVSYGGTGAAPGGDDQVLVSSSTSAAAWKTLPDCDADNQTLAYDQATNAFSCGDDDSSGAASGFETFSVSGYTGCGNTTDYMGLGSNNANCNATYGNVDVSHTGPTMTIGNLKCRQLTDGTCTIVFTIWKNGGASAVSAATCTNVASCAGSTTTDTLTAGDTWAIEVKDNASNCSSGIEVDCTFTGTW